MEPIVSDRRKTNDLPRLRSPHRRPFDIVHLAHTTFPEDPRPRREVMIAAEIGERTAIVVLGGHQDGPRVSRFGRVVVIRLPGKRRRGSVGKYLLEYVDFLFRSWALIRRDPRFRHAAVYHVHTLPDFLIAATGPARRKGARVILDLHEVFPEFTRSKFGGMAGKVGERIARWLERWSRRRADVVVTVNHAVARQLQGRPARANERVRVIHNFADPGEFGPPRITSGRVHDPIKLVYHGTVTRLYGLDLAVDGVALARSRGVEAVFDIYGGGPAEADLASQIERLGLGGTVRLRGTVSHHELRHLLPTYDAGLVPTRLDGMTRFSLSTKLLEYIHLGLPVIVPAIPTYQEYFGNDTAWYFSPNSPEGISQAIAEFAAASPAERVRRAEAAQLASATQLDPARDADTLREIYRELL